MKKLIGLLVGMAAAVASADVVMSATECAAAHGPLPITIVNKNTYPQSMVGFMASLNGTIIESKFQTAGKKPYLVAPNASPDFNYVSCSAIGTPKHLQLETSLGSCGDLEPPDDAPPMACTPLKTAKMDYDPNTCVKDSLGTQGGDGFGGIVDSYKNNTQIQVRIPTAAFTVGGKSVRFDPKSMGGPYYMMGLMAVQEYFFVDAQFLMALGASKSGAGLVDAATGLTSQYVPAINDGVSKADSKMGSFGLNMLTVEKVMADYPKHFTGADDIKMMVADNGTGTTLANSPQQVNSAMLGAMNLWWYLDATQNSQALCFKSYIKTAKDKSAGLKILLAGYENGPGGGGGGVADFASLVLPPTANPAAHTATDITPFMKPYLWGDASTGKGTTQYITNVFSSLNEITKSGSVCGGDPVYDSPISRSELKGLFFGQGGTAAKPGPGGLHWHIKMTQAERTALELDLDCAFDALKGKSPSTIGMDAISFRYDFLSALRVAKSHFRNYLDKFGDPPSPGDGYSSEYNSFVGAHQTPTCPEIFVDTEWPRLVLTGESINKGQTIESPATKDNRGIESRQYSTDPNWVNWIEAPAAFTVPATLAAGQGLWYRVSDSCGNTTTEKVPWTDGPPLDKPVATPPGGAFFGTVSVTLDVPGVTGEDIYYTTDNTVPTSGSTKWDPTKPIVFNADATLKAFAIKSGFSPSEVVTWTFTKSFLPVTKPPTANPNGRNFTTLDPEFTVTLIEGEPGSTIFYTTNGTDPDTVERPGVTMKYTTPIPVSTTMKIKAVAIKLNQRQSDFVTFDFKETEAPKVAKPVATPPGAAGTSPHRFLSGPLPVTITDSTAGAQIMVRLDDAAPVPYTAALAISKTTVVKAFATKDGYFPSDTLVVQFLFTPPVSVSKAYYKDLDGDGMIETVIVEFEKDIPVVPEKLGFKIIDEGGQTNERTAVKTEIQFGASKSKLVVTLATPFPHGVTSVSNRDASGKLFAQENIPLLDNNFAVEDSVAPVVAKATVQEPDSTNPQKRIFVSLSESTNLPLTSQTVLVFKHEGAEVPPAELRISRIEKTGDRAFVVYIDTGSQVYPIVGDSLALNNNGEVKDAAGNSPAKKAFRKMDGIVPKPKPTDVYVTFPNGRKDQASDGREAQGEWVFLPMDQNGNALTGSAADGKCAGTCYTGDGGTYVGPVIHIVTAGPVTWDFSIFNNVGEFLGKGHGRITDQDLKVMEKKNDASGVKYIARVVWTGRTPNGGKAGTGAYILQSSLTTDKDSRTGAPPAKATKRVTFGLLRSFRGS